MYIKYIYSTYVCILSQNLLLHADEVKYMYMDPLGTFVHTQRENVR